jgi:hypothetical protein
LCVKILRVKGHAGAVGYDKVAVYNPRLEQECGIDICDDNTNKPFHWPRLNRDNVVQADSCNR